MTNHSSARRFTRAIVLLALAATALFQAFALFQDPGGQAIAIGYFACAITTMVAWFLRARLQAYARQTDHARGSRFILLGSLGAAWVETLFWAAERITGATGVAASPNLLVDLAVTMPWYVAMVAVFWLVYRRYQYSWPTVALLGGLYEVAADGIVGGLLSGNPITIQFLGLLFIYYWSFVVVYSPIVLPPVWAFPPSSPHPLGTPLSRALAALAPLAPLVPYYFLIKALFA